jgi:CRP-like cAMP-binding protein
MTRSGNANSDDLLWRMSEAEQKALADMATTRRLRAGDFVYTQGDPAQHFYIVESGRIRVFYQTPAGREPTVTYPGRGHLFGISHLGRGDHRVTTAQALEPTSLWAIANEDLDELTRRLPTLASGIIRALASRLREVMVLVESVATWPARLRVANFLLADRDRVRGAGASGQDGWTHESIADRLGCTRQTVTGALNTLAREGWVRVERRHVTVVDRRALERLVTAELPAIPARPRTSRAV